MSARLPGATLQGRKAARAAFGDRKWRRTWRVTKAIGLHSQKRIVRSEAEVQNHSEMEGIFSFAHNRKRNRKLEIICRARVRCPVN